MRTFSAPGLGWQFRHRLESPNLLGNVVTRTYASGHPPHARQSDPFLCTNPFCFANRRCGRGKAPDNLCLDSATHSGACAPLCHRSSASLPQQGGDPLQPVFCRAAIVLLPPWAAPIPTLSKRNSGGMDRVPLRFSTVRESGRPAPAHNPWLHRRSVLLCCSCRN